MKKQESVLNVLMYLLNNHMDKNQQVDLDDMQLIDELKSAGFHAHSIGKAFRWLHNLAELSEQLSNISEQTFRVFNAQETELMDHDSLDFILSLEHQGILTAQTREVVIHQTLELINEGVDVSLIKWVTLMVLFNMPGCEDELAHMEFLIQSSAFDNVH